jgi:hypothetical protein
MLGLGPAASARSVVEHHPNDKAEPRYDIHELRAVLASVSTVPREVMYSDRAAFFLDVGTGTHIDGRHDHRPSNHPRLAQRT